MSGFKYLLVLIIALFIFACESQLENEGGIFRVDEIFKNESINKLVYKSLSFVLDSLPDKNRRDFLRKNFVLNNQNSVVHLGNSFEKKDGWIYFEVWNTGQSLKKLSLFTNNTRCDSLMSYYLVNDSLKANYGLSRETRFSKRAYPDLNFAIPIQVEKGDTVGVLVQSYRTVGYNELILELIEEDYYEDHIVNTQFFKLSIIITAITTCFFLLFLGVLYKQKLLIAIGVYCGFLSLGLSATFSLQDVLPLPVWSGLNGANFTQFTPSLSNAAVFFLLIQLLGLQVNSKRKGMLFLCYFMVFLNLMTCFLLVFFKDYNRYITYHFQVVTLLTFVITILAILKHTLDTRKYYFLAAVTLGLVSNLIENLFRIFFANEYPVSVLSNFSLAPFGIFLLAVAGIMEVRHQLISKDTSDKELTKTKQKLDELRKDEIESIGRNLHDNLGNTLASALGYLNLPGFNPEKVKNLLLEVIRDVRVISHNFVKEDNLPIISKLEKLTDQFNEFSNTNYKFRDFSTKKLNELDAVKQRNLYHIIQELYTNIFKHAHAKEVTLQIFHNVEKYWLTIEDDGIGFNRLNEDQGIGLINIQKRADLSNFKLSIDSSENGTYAVIEIL